jgi:Ca2+-binding EF-hand superfamily protein
MQKKKMNLSEMSILMSAFKFYDLNDRGIVSKTQWTQTMMKIGMSGFSEKDLAFIFDLYDPRLSGIIDYRAFAQNLLSNNLNTGISYGNSYENNYNNGYGMNSSTNMESR